jgi:hypothetical protein
VLSGTPGIGKTTALRNILADYPSGYLLIYLSPRIQVNMDLMAKFDPTHEGNNLKGKEELICINTNSTLIKVANSHHGKAALSCCSHKIPDDPNFLFLSQKDAESLEIKEPKNQSNYRRTEISATTEVSRDTHHGVFKTIMQAIHRLNDRYGYKRIIACVATQSNRQLNRETTTVGAHLSKMFGDSHKKLDIASIEQFANNIKEIVFFIDEVTGDGAGRQTVQEMIQFCKDVINKFDDVGKSCPLKFRVLIADASLVNASSVESYLNEKQSQPEQILFTGDADRKIICLIPTFSIESNFMEFWQGMYRGRGSGKGNQLNREIELIIPQVLVAPTGGSTKAILF